MIVKKKIYVTPEVTFELMEGEDLLTFSHTAGDHTTEHSNPGDDAPGTITGDNIGDGTGMNGAKGAFFDWGEEW